MHSFGVLEDMWCCCNKSMCGQITWTHNGWNHTKYILQWDKWTEMSSLLHALLDHLSNFFPTLQCHNQTIMHLWLFFRTTRITLSIIKQDMPAIDVGITSSLFYVFLEILEIFVGNSMISWIFFARIWKQNPIKKKILQIFIHGSNK